MTLLLIISNRYFCIESTKYDMLAMVKNSSCIKKEILDYLYSSKFITHTEYLRDKVHVICYSLCLNYIIEMQ